MIHLMRKIQSLATHTLLLVDKKFEFKTNFLVCFQFTELYLKTELLFSNNFNKLRNFFSVFMINYSKKAITKLQTVKSSILKKFVK